jgi:hypothetical protein
MSTLGWTKTDADIPTYDLGADSSYYVEQWGMGSWAAYHDEQAIGEPGSYGTRAEAEDAAEAAYLATVCDACGNPLVAGQGDGNTCRPCTEKGEDALAAELAEADAEHELEGRVS